MQVPPPPPAFGNPSVPPALPLGWTQHAAPDGQPYYFNAASGTSTYVRPAPAGFSQTGLVPPPPPPPAGFAAPEAGQPSTSASAIAPAPVKKEKKKKKEKPVEKIPIEGTPWLKVTTNEGNVFYTNTESKTSVWTVPEEIRQQVEELERKASQQNSHAENGQAQAEALRLLQEKEAEMQQLREELEREREASRKRKAAEEEQAEGGDQTDPQAKRARTSSMHEEEEQIEGDGVADQSEEPGDHQQQKEDADEDAEEQLADWVKDEIEGKAALAKELETPEPAGKADEPLSSEEGIALFKTMLAEKDINPMRPWDMELPKFIGDARYKSVKSLRERRDLFDEHCKQKVRENRARKSASGQTKKDPASAYRAFLVAEVTSTRTKWDDFKAKHKKDARFRDFGRDDRERERAFRVWLKELGEIKRADAEKAEQNFIEMLQESSLDADSTWSQIKSRFSSDPRYSAVQSSSQRENLFKIHLDSRATQAAQKDIDPEETKRQAAEDRKAKQAASLREREEKVRREKAIIDRTAGRSRADAGREVGERHFRALLLDAVRDHDARWSDMQSSLESDPRYSSSNLSIGDKRQLFETHQNELYDKRLKAVESLFAAKATNMQTPFERVFPQIESDPAITRMKMSAERMKRLFEDWSKRRFSQAQKDFEQLLSESTFVEYWGRLKQENASKEDERAKELLGAADEEGDGAINLEEGTDLKTMAAQIDLKELQAVLKHDKRYIIFDYDPYLRERWIQDHIAKIGRPKQTVHQH